MLVLEVIFKLVVNKGRNMISPWIPFLEYLDKEKCLKAEVFSLFMLLTLTFSHAKVCWKKKNTLHIQIRIWHLRVLAMQKFNNVALVVLIIFEVVKSSTFCTTFETKQA